MLHSSIIIVVIIVVMRALMQPNYAVTLGYNARLAIRRLLLYIRD